MLEINFDGIMEVLEDEGRVVICCETKDKEVDLKKNLSGLGYKWFSGDDLCDYSFWDVYGERTCFTIYSLGKFVTFDDCSDVSHNEIYSYTNSSRCEPYKGDYLYTWELFGFMDSYFDEIKGSRYKLMGNSTGNNFLERGSIVEVGETIFGERSLFLDGTKIDRFSNLERWEEVEIEPIGFQELIEFISGKDVPSTTLKFIYERDIKEGDNIVDEGNLDDIIYRLSYIYNDKVLSEMLLNGKWFIE